MKDLVLRNEPYIAQYNPNRIVRNRLTLREEHGRIRVIANGPCQERLLLSKGARTKVDQKTCQSITRRGFKHSIVLGGLSRNPLTRQREYRRYQIFNAERFRQNDRRVLYNFFKEFIPKKRIDFYIYHEGNLYMEGCPSR
jgi:hypothetical protein